MAFFIDRRKVKKSGECPICAKIHKFGFSFSTTVGYSIHPEKWNDETKRVKKGCSNSDGFQYYEINGHLNDIEAYFSRWECKRSGFSAKSIKDEYRRVFCGQKQTKDFSAVYDLFLRDIETKIADNTYKSYERIRNKVTGFYKSPGLSFFNSSGIADFVGRMFADGERNTAVRQNVVCLFSFLRWCERNGHLNDSDYEAYKFDFPKVKSNEIIYLTDEELKKVVGYEASGILELVRDIFVFCCFTSLRISDALSLRRSDISNGRIKIIIKKTSTAVTIELNEYSKKIFAKYNDFGFRERLFPPIAEVTIVRNIKRLCRLCDIDTPVSFSYFVGNKRVDLTRPKYQLMGTHTARRTFIVRALSMGIPPSVVMKWTGHTNYNSMKPYIDITEQAKSEQMKKFDAPL